jgi:hypothetical protein
MNFSAVMPRPTISIYQPHKVSPKGNLYKIPIMHTSADGKQTHNFEIWATKEAVQQHFQNNMMGGEPRAFELKKFARQMYEKQLRSSAGQLQPHKGMLVTTDNITHGDPRLWPSSLSHPEVKV